MSESPPSRTSDPAAQTSVDARMADLLQGEARPRRRLRDSLRDEATPAADDLLGRLNALEFVDTLVGEVTEMPERLGDYRITGLLGRGGMGTVYAAFQESLEREVALKVLAPNFSADVTMRERFRTEARATASLHHEHIVPIYDFGEAAGVLFFAMEKVDGVSLDKHISAARRLGRPVMGPQQAAERFAGVAEALHHAHRRNILHRDVKPGNLLVGPDGTVALADFGLSKMIGEVSKALTVGGAFLGTLSYAPPEQAKGQRPSPAGDLYSLGVTMFETITGELPLSGKSTEAMLEAVLHGTPTRLRDVLPKAPRDLEAVLDKLLQKDPVDRYADGEELARDLQRIAEGEPVHIRRQPLWHRAWRRAKKNPPLSIAIAAASVLAIVTVVLGVVTSQQHVKTVEARYANHLQQAMREASRQAGPPQGPAGLLAALTGTSVAAEVPRDEVVVQLGLAEKLVPDRPEAPGLLDAYLDPLAQATDLLLNGKGHQARQLLDQAIEAARPGFETLDNATWLRMYHLYVARAVASLSAAVAREDDAKTDLSNASIIRTNAFFPKLLLAFVDWAPDPERVDLVARVQKIVQDSGPGGAEQVAACLLRAFSGLGRPSGCNLMDVDVSYSKRLEIYQAALSLQGNVSPPSTEPASRWWSGLEQSLADVALETVRVFGDPVALSPIVARGLGILRREVDPEAPMQSWAFVFDLLADPTAPRSTADPQVLQRQVRGWIDLLRLEPRQDFVELMAPRIKELLTRHPGAARAAELRGMLARITGSPSDLLDAAKKWYEAEPDHPGALLCQFHSEVLLGRVPEASVSAVRVLQKVVDRRPVFAEIASALRAAEQRATNDQDTAAAKRWGEVRRSFERFEEGG